MKLAALLLLTVVTAAAQQLPPGTTDATAPPPPDPLFAQAEAALQKADYAAALPLLTRLAQNHPNDAGITYDLGYAQDGLNHNADAEASYRKALQLKPGYPEAHVSLGLLLAREGHTASAHAELQAAASSTDAEPAVKAAADRALAQLDQNSNPAQARDELLAALKLSPETPADILLGAQLAEAAKDPAAEAAFRRFLALHPDDLQATNGLAHVLITGGKPAEAEQVLLATQLTHPDDPELQAQLIQAYLAEKKPAEAVSMAEKLHAAHPKDPNVTHLLAHLYDQLGQADKSEPLYEALIAAKPGDPMLLDERAANLIQLGRPGEAETLLKKAIIFPESFPTPQDYGLAASHLAYAANQTGDYETVLQALSLRAKVLPQSASSLYMQATATDSLHQSKQAAELYRQFLTAANGKFPEEEAAARKRIAALQHGK